MTNNENAPELGPIEKLMSQALGNAPRQVLHEDFDGGNPYDARRKLNSWLAKNREARIISIESLMVYSSPWMSTDVYRSQQGIRVWYELGAIST